jgi:hypothetical protein
LKYGSFLLRLSGSVRRRRRAGNLALNTGLWFLVCSPDANEKLPGSETKRSPVFSGKKKKREREIRTATLATGVT